MGGVDVLELIRRWWVGLMFRVYKKMVGGNDVLELIRIWWLRLMFRVYKKWWVGLMF